MTRDTNHNTTDNLDTLLRQWHDRNADSARANRDALLSRLAREDKAVVAKIGDDEDDTRAITARRNPWKPFATAWMPVAASLAIMVTMVASMMGGHRAHNPTPFATSAGDSIDQMRAGTTIQRASFVPKGGRLDAIDPEGNIVGSCPLKHTDVKASIQGRFARVAVKQHYANPFPDKIEAVYTFPLSSTGAVDRMTMTIADRVIVGEVKGRTAARNIYQQARAQGRAAALLEQERPNIFTQSVANIEPGAEITVEISYVEMIHSSEGEYTFTFPMTVAPRYIPGYAAATPERDVPLPAGLMPRAGDILRSQASVTTTAGQLTAGQVDAILEHALPIQSPVDEMPELEDLMNNRRKADFIATYADGTQEVGIIFDNNTGALNNRWFYFPLDGQLQPLPAGETIAPSKNTPGAPFTADTDQVPDASRITPTPVPPDTRAGHDISMSINLETGGPGLIDLTSTLHKIETIKYIRPNDFTAPVGAHISLANENEIPNKDFVLKWRLADESIENQVFSYNGSAGGFLTLSMLPPARTPFTETIVVPRELVFVLDTSGSMNGHPIEKAKEVMTRAISQMRAFDSFNVITFAGSTRILWDAPKPATPENIAEANNFVNSRSGSGGTEMMAAINAALAQTVRTPNRQWITPEQLLDGPLNGDEVTVRARMSGRKYLNIEGHQHFQLPANHARAINTTVEHWTVKLGVVVPDSIVTLELKGRYLSDDLDAPKFVVSHAALIPNDFLTAEELLNLPADGRRVELLINSFSDQSDPLIEANNQPAVRLSAWVAGLRTRARIIEHEFRKATAVGWWYTKMGERVFVMDQWGGEGDIEPARPVRICMFLTDGQVGNDHAIIDAVKNNADTTRVFSFGVGNAPNRYLLDGIALAGRGAADYATLNSDAEPIVDRFVTRIQTPVLSDVSIEFNTPMPMLDIVSPNVHGQIVRDPATGAYLFPDLYQRTPITLHARFNHAGNTDLAATATVRGRTRTGPFERVIQLNFPRANPIETRNPQPSVLPTLWAREKVNQILATDLSGLQLGQPRGDVRTQVITLGETFSIMTPFTSFVAVDRARVTIEGQPRLVHVPVELPEGQSYEGIFGQACRQKVIEANKTQFGFEGDVDPIDAAHKDNALRRESESVSPYRANTGGVIPTLQGSSARTDELILAASEVARMTNSDNAVFDRMIAQNPNLLQATELARLDEFRAVESYDYMLKADQSLDLGLTTRGISPERERVSRIYTVSPPVESTGTSFGFTETATTDKQEHGRILSLIAEGDTLEMDEASKSTGGLENLDRDATDTRLGIAPMTADEAEPSADTALASPPETSTISNADTQRDQLLRAAAIYAHLARVLHPTLQQALVQTLDQNERGEPDSAETVEQVRVTVLLKNADKAAIKALYDAGLKVESTHPTLNVVVGRIKPTDLLDLAMTEGVRRVEPTRSDDR